MHLLGRCQDCCTTSRYFFKIQQHAHLFPGEHRTLPASPRAVPPCQRQCLAQRGPGLPLCHARHRAPPCAPHTALHGSGEGRAQGLGGLALAIFGRAGGLGTGHECSFASYLDRGFNLAHPGRHVRGPRETSACMRCGASRGPLPRGESPSRLRQMPGWQCWRKHDLISDNLNYFSLCHLE
jgi:hypothetical protein